LLLVFFIRKKHEIYFSHKKSNKVKLDLTKEKDNTNFLSHTTCFCERQWQKTVSASLVGVKYELLSRCGGVRLSLRRKGVSLRQSANPLEQQRRRRRLFGFSRGFSPVCARARKLPSFGASSHSSHPSFSSFFHDVVVVAIAVVVDNDDDESDIRLITVPEKGELEKWRLRLS